MLTLEGCTLRLPANYAEARNIILESNCAHFSLKDAIRLFESKDCVDAARDCETLAALMQQRCKEVLGV